MLHHVRAEQVGNAQMNPAKTALRTAILAQRAEFSTATLAAAAATTARHVVAAVRGAGAVRVCAYVPIGSEPGSTDLLDELRLGGVEVLLPVRRDDLDLDWAPYEGPDALVSAGHGLREPAGRRLGVEAICTVELAIVPALAVDGAGNRLGRGGGSYDRALARVSELVPVAALLHDGELLPLVPHDAHDRPVSHTVTPARGWERAGRAP